MVIKESNNNTLRSFWDLKNADSLFDEFIELLKKFDKDQNSYETDVYLYVDDNNTGELYEFVNVGGNSWLDDDHYTLYVDKQHYENYLDWYQSVYEIADTLGMSEDELKEEALVGLGMQDDYDIGDIDYSDVIEYLNTREDYTDTLYEIYCDCIDTDFDTEYRDKAKEIIYGFDEDLSYTD